MAKSSSELDYFSNLSSNDKSLRISSVRAILKRIKQNSQSGQHVVYLICKRLVRGLGGSNPVFRQGCFSAVVGFLRILPADFELNLLEDIITNELSPSGNNSKQEEGEAYLGQSLAYGAMIMSDFALSKSDEEQEAIFAKLFEISRKRSYLHHVSFAFMTMLLKKTKKEYSPDGFLAHLRDLETFTLDKLNFLLTLAELPIKTHTIKKIFDTKNFHDASNASKITILLKKNKSLAVLEHDFFKVFTIGVIKHLEFFKQFWDAFCDKATKIDTDDVNFDRSKNNSDLFILHLGKRIFIQCVKEKNSTIPHIVFKNKFINIILKYSKKDKTLVQSVLTELCNALKLANDDVKLNVITHILFEEGLLNFDNSTNSRTINTLSNSLSFNGITMLANEYKAVLEFKKEIPKKDIESKNKGAIICLNFLTKIINNPVCCDELNWRLSQLVYLLKLGFFKHPHLQFNRELNQCIQEAFLTSLGHRFPNLEAFQQVLEGIVTEMNKLLLDPKLSLINPFTDDMNTAWNSAVVLGKKMDKYIEKYPSNKEKIIVLKIILQYMAIILLKEQSTAFINIQDLKNIYEELTEKRKNEETMWIGVLIDLFLNLLSKPNYHHRHIIKCTFKFICPHLTQEAFLQIIDVLNPSYQSEEMEDDDDVEDDKEDDEEKAEGSEDDSSESSDEEDPDDELSTNEKLRFELRSALGGGSDTESVNLDDMDEDEGKMLDETLSNIFRANVKRRKTNHLSKYQNQLAHFRTRVMDLVEICTEVVLPLSYWVKAIIPIVELFGSTIGQSKLDCLRSRISCCLKKLSTAKTIPDEVSVTEIVETLESLLDKLAKASGVYADMKAELVQTVKFLIKASKTFKKGIKPKHIETNEIFQCIRKYFVAFFEGKNNIPLQLFTGLASIGWEGIFVMVPEILKFSFEENFKPHKKLTGLQIVGIFCKTPQFFDGHLQKYYPHYIPVINELFTECILKEINSMCNSKTINNKYHTELWVLLNVIINKQNNNQIPTIIDIEKIKEILGNNVTNFPTMKNNCKKSFRKLCNLLSVNNNKQSPVKSGEQSFLKDKCLGDNSDSKTKKSLLKRKRKGEIINNKKKKVKTTKLNS